MPCAAAAMAARGHLTRVMLDAAPAASQSMRLDTCRPGMTETAGVEHGAQGAAALHDRRGGGVCVTPR